MQIAKRPNSSLPPESQPWGRWVDGELDTLSARGERLSESVSNLSRVTNSQLELMANQIGDLQSADVRLGLQWGWEAISTTPFNAASGTVTLNQSPLLPPPDVGRYGWVSMKLVLAQSVPQNTTAVVTMRIDDSIFVNRSVMLQPNPQVPSSWQASELSVPGWASFEHNGTETKTIQISVAFTGVGTTLRTASYRASATVQYGQRLPDA